MQVDHALSTLYGQNNYYFYTSFNIINLAEMVKRNNYCNSIVLIIIPT